MAETKNITERFWPQVRASGDCWVWTGCKDRDGYGVIRHEGRQWRTNRLAWFLACGPIPDGLCVLHRCDTPACVRIEHLWLGTNAENIADRNRKGRTCGGAEHSAVMRRVAARGERVKRARLTASVVREMRERRRAGESLSRLSQAFGVTTSAVCHVVAHRSWKHVT